MKIILVVILISFSLGHWVSANTIMLKPSLTAQMQRQTEIDKVNYITEKKLKNKLRLAEIQAQKKANIKTVRNTSKNIQSTSIKPIYSVPIITTPRYSVSSSIPWVDMNRVRATWMGWYNSTRNALWLWSYTWDSRLDSTAYDWNIVFARGKWENHHRRNPGDSYYDFPVIDAWFSARGINPKVVNRVKNTENVGYGYYSCNESDCTDELIASIRSTYDFFMSEKGKSYDAHYRSIVQPYFTKIGMDIIVVPSEKRYYMTIHYITE